LNKVILKKSESKFFSVILWLVGKKLSWIRTTNIFVK
jgi:hypothetical protein